MLSEESTLSRFLRCRCRIAWDRYRLGSGLDDNEGIKGQVFEGDFNFKVCLSSIIPITPHAHPFPTPPPFTRVLPSAPVTPPLTPRLPVIVFPEKDSRWVQCSAANDGDGPAIRGWSPRGNDRFPAVEISFDGWNPFLVLSADPSTSLFHPPASLVPPKMGLGLSFGDVHLQSTDSQDTICAGDTLRTPRASVLNTTPGSVAVRKEKEPIAQESHSVYSRRDGPTWVAQNAGQAMRKRNAMGAFLPSTVSPFVPVSEGAQSTSNAQQPRLALHPSARLKVMPTSRGYGWTPEPEPSEVDAKLKARPLTLLPPHLARSITRNAAAIRAQDCEKSINKAAQNFPRSSASYWSSTTSAGSRFPHVDMNADTPTLPHPDLQWQEHSPEIPVAPPCTPVLPLESQLESPPAQSSYSQSQNFTSESLLPSRQLSTTSMPVSMPSRLPSRLGRTASDPGSQQLLRNLATSLARGFMQEVKPSEIIPSQDRSRDTDAAETKDSQSDAVISAVCAWAAGSRFGASSVLTDGIGSPEEQSHSKREIPVEDYEQPTAKKLRVV